MAIKTKTIEDTTINVIIVVHDQMPCHHDYRITFCFPDATPHKNAGTIRTSNDCCSIHHVEFHVVHCSGQV